MEENQKQNGSSEGGELVEVEGEFFPKFFERSRPMKEHIECIRAMRMRDDDVILCAYSKSGTHWLWEVASMLLAGKAEYENRTKEHVMMEACDVEDLEKLPSPRLLNTHFPVAMLPNEVKDKDGKVKVIHVYRNPKDVIVSMYHHEKQLPFNSDIPLAHVLDLFLSDKCPYGNYFKFLRQMDSFIKEKSKDSVFNVSFEDMKEDPIGTTERLAKFLGLDASRELCESIADACSFQKLKEADESKQEQEWMKSLNMQMYRKGQVGDWKNHITVAQSERVDAAMEQLKDCQYNFRYTL